MRVDEKNERVKELKIILEKTNFEALLKNCDDLEIIKPIHRAIAIFKNYRLSEGRRLEHLFKEFQRHARAGERRVHILNCLNDMVQFLSQKTEEMEIIENKEDMDKKQEKVIKELKNEELYVRQVLEGEDMHVFISEKGKKEHVHLIFDGETGEVRIDPGDQPPLELLDKVASITTKSGDVIEAKVQNGETSLEFKKKEERKDNLPVLYVSGNRRSGGPKGQFEYFTIKNISDFTAVDVVVKLRSFEKEWSALNNKPFFIDPRGEKEVEFKYPEDLLLNQVHEPNLVLEYKDSMGNAYFTRRELMQERVPSGAFFVFKLGTFHPPSIMHDDGLKVESDLTAWGDGDMLIFSIPYPPLEKKFIKIGMSRTLSSICGLSTEALLKNALIELGHRKIRRMVKEDAVKDYLFTTSDIQDNSKAGFDRYLSLRDSI